MTENLELAGDLLRGIPEIAEHFGRKPRTIQHLLDEGLLPGAFKLGGVWYLRRSTARVFIEEMERQAVAARSLLDRALYLCGDPGIQDREREFVENMRDGDDP
jgi:hypothetical protein